jgi:hypothetical protein
MYCCGAGTAADTEYTTNLISSKLALHRLNSRKEVRVATAMTMLKQYLFRYQGHVGAALILGGVDVTGPHLYTIYPHGSTDQLPYVTMGSGSLAAMAIFEAGYKNHMNVMQPHQSCLTFHFRRRKGSNWSQRPSRLVSLTTLARVVMWTLPLSLVVVLRCCATI